MRKLALLICLWLLLPITSAGALVSKPVNFTAEIWADNWFALYANGKKVGEDSVPITTQKSFNSQTIKFSATYPLTIGFVAKDYVQSSSGLEYLGQPNQQIGDGGLIFQIKETQSQKIVTYSDQTWKAFVSNIAPLNVDCEKSPNPDLDCKFRNFTIPSSWASPTFKDSSWGNAKLFTAEEVGPKEGYFDISWLSSAKFIWSSDLKLHNIVYFRKKITAASAKILT
jgi:hypothetical protein